MIKLTFRKNLYLLTAACAMLGIAFALLVWVLAPVRVVAQGPTEISSDDLIAYWKLDEGSGSTAADSSDNGYDLSLNTGVMTYTSDIPTLSFSNTYALDFTGSGEANSASAKVDSLQELSIALWVKPDTLSGINRFLTLGNEKAVLRSQNSGDLHFYMKIDGSLQYIVTGTVATGGWQHVAGTYDSSVMRLYLDGSEVGTLSYTGVVSAGNGVHLSAGGSESLDGKLDDIRIYNRALSANEIALLASGSEGFACATEYSGDTTTDFVSSDNSALQLAVDNAPAGSTIKAAGACAGVQNINSLTQTVYISKNLTIQGGYTTTNWTVSNPVTNPTTLDALDNGRVAYIPSGVTVTLDSLTLQNGYTSGDGAGIYSSGALTLTNSLLRENWAGSEGGGLYAHQNGVSTFISNTRIISNTSWDGGGGFYANQPITIVNSVVNSNTTTSYGGGGQLEAGAQFFIQNSAFISNTNIKFEGGGLYILSTGTIQNSRVLSNTAFGSEGGGLYLESNAVVALLDSEVAYNQAARGGGIHSYDSRLDVQNSAIHHNTAIEKMNGSGGEGGGLSLQRSVITITRSTIVHNAAELNGGGLYVEEITSVDLLNSTLSHNQAITGGGIYAIASSGTGNRSAAISLTHTTLYSNTATQGGGIYLKDAINGNDDI
ncbi:MAG: hypothetical protein GY832_17670, partial [Chloroflexi bacterium]|nr:hypothetical protein [Chloroflexota bacterium]